MPQSLALILSLASAFSAADQAAEKPAAQSAPTPIDWAKEEAGVLSDHVQITFPEKFVKAGEAYFNGTGSWIVFQAVPRPKSGETASDVYSMYVAKVKFDEKRNVTGIEEPIQISPEGSANTCGYFNPTKPWEVIFGSTMTKPAANDAPGYQRGTRSYRWAFPTEMDVVKVTIPAIATSRIGRSPTGGSMNTGKPSEPVALISGPAYDAECSYDPEGRYIVYASQKGMDETTHRPKIGLDLYDTVNKTSSQLTTTDGYNGGPFFSQDGTMICMRADRKGNDLLQVYVIKLDRAPDGTIKGVKGEYPVTDNEHVNWAPFFHPSGEFVVYATSEVGHDNYEVYAVEVPRVANMFKKPELLAKKRVTHASGFDGLPVFSPEGDWMMWTSQRGAKIEGETKPSSQIWVAKVVNVKP